MSSCRWVQHLFSGFSRFLNYGIKLYHCSGRAYSRRGKCNFIRTLKLYHLWSGAQSPGVRSREGRDPETVTRVLRLRGHEPGPGAWQQRDTRDNMSEGRDLVDVRSWGVTDVMVTCDTGDAHYTVQGDTRVTRANLARTNGSNNNKSQQSFCNNTTQSTKL